jgi:hypothetical protein
MDYMITHLQHYGIGSPRPVVVVLPLIVVLVVPDGTEVVVDEPPEVVVDEPAVVVVVGGGGRPWGFQTSGSSLTSP